MHKSIRQFLEDLQCLPGESNADWCSHLRCWKWPHVQKCSCVKYDGHECCTKENVCNLQSDQHVYLRIHGIKTFWGRTDYLVMFLCLPCRLLKKSRESKRFYKLFQWFKQWSAIPPSFILSFHFSLLLWSVRSGGLKTSSYHYHTRESLKF